jgi:cytochrome c5
MRSSHRSLAVAVILLLLAACARSTLPVASPAQARWAAARWPGHSAEDLERGRKLYRGRCAGCHLPVDPTSVPAGEWPMHVREMKKRSGMNDREAVLVERYLVTMATPHAVAGSRANP